MTQSARRTETARSTCRAHSCSLRVLVNSQHSRPQIWDKKHRKLSKPRARETDRLLLLGRQALLRWSIGTGSPPRDDPESGGCRDRPCRGSLLVAVEGRFHRSRGFWPSLCRNAKGRRPPVNRGTSTC